MLFPKNSSTKIFVLELLEIYISPDRLHTCPVAVFDPADVRLEQPHALRPQHRQTRAPRRTRFQTTFGDRCW